MMAGSLLQDSKYDVGRKHNTVLTQITLTVVGMLVQFERRTWNRKQ